MYCPRCGTTLADTTTSCSNCQLELTKSTPTGPYNPIIDTGFTSGALLLMLFPLVGLLARTSIPDSMIINYGGLALAALGPIAGLGAIFLSSGADSLRARDNRPATRGKISTAKKLTLVGWLVGTPLMVVVVGLAFLKFATGAPHVDKAEAEAMMTGEKDAVAGEDGAPEAVKPAAEGGEEAAEEGGKGAEEKE